MDNLINEDPVLKVPVETVAEKDILDRQEFVNRLFSFCNILSNNKKNACFAVNGKWGTGKSFVLDMFEEQIKKEHNSDTQQLRYLVFRYNCWEYDYYEEPLVAMIASISDQVDEKINLIPEEARTKIKDIIENLKNIVVESFITTAQTKTGFPLKQVYDAVHNGLKKEPDHSYDAFFG